MTKQIFSQNFDINRTNRENRNGHKGHVFWITGLSGSGKSTVANGLEQQLFDKDIRTYTLDGDNIRSGINADLGFDQDSRKENIRRIAEIAKLMCDAGMAVICCFITPLQSDRELARQIIGKGDFTLVYVDCPVETCMERDVKGLYQRAVKGEIADFTGVSSPYEAPENPDIHILSAQEQPAESIDKIVKYAEKKLKL